MSVGFKNCLQESYDGGLARSVGTDEHGDIIKELHIEILVTPYLRCLERGDAIADNAIPFHPATPFSRNTSHTRSGRIGISTCVTPRCASASTTAFAIAGGAPTVADSPTPFAPSG